LVVTDNLYLAGLALTRGGELRGVSVRGTNGRRIAVFAIDGPDVAAAEREYFAGRTLVDLRLLRAIRNSGVSSGSQSRRGKSQRPRSVSGRQEGNRRT
jgi:hypothetical protein